MFPVTTLGVVLAGTCDKSQDFVAATVPVCVSPLLRALQSTHDEDASTAQARQEMAGLSGVRIHTRFRHRSLADKEPWPESRDAY